MKKFVVLILFLALILSLSGCFGSKSGLTDIVDIGSNTHHPVSGMIHV